MVVFSDRETRLAQQIRMFFFPSHTYLPSSLLRWQKLSYLFLIHQLKAKQPPYPLSPGDRGCQFPRESIPQARLRRILTESAIRDKQSCPPVGLSHESHRISETNQRRMKVTAKDVRCIGLPTVGICFFHNPPPVASPETLRTYAASPAHILVRRGQTSKHRLVCVICTMRQQSHSPLLACR